MNGRIGHALRDAGLSRRAEVVACGVLREAGLDHGADAVAVRPSDRGLIVRLRTATADIPLDTLAAVATAVRGAHLADGNIIVEIAS